MKFKYVKEIKNIENIEELEEKLGIYFPDEYVDFITKNNNGRPILNTFKTLENKERVVKKFCSFNKEDRENIFEAYSWVEGSELSEKEVPIALDPSGNYIYFNEFFEVYFFNHETRDREKISNDFLSFLEALN